MNTFSAALVPLLLAAAPLADVIVVDDDGGPGVDATQLQAAIEIAVSGDTLLVHPGNYASSVVQGKGLSIVADAPAVTVRGLSVRAIAEPDAVVLRGLNFAANPGAIPPEPVLSILNCAGTVLVEDCTALAGQGTTAVRAENSLATTFQRCNFTGGAGGFAESGGDALATTDSNVSVFACALTGVAGGSGGIENAPCDGGAGGHGASVAFGSLSIAGSTLSGGEGGEGGFDSDIFGPTCYTGGWGGSGVWGSGTLFTREVTYAPGLGGPGYSKESCPAGPNGKEIDLFLGESTIWDASVAVLSADSPVRSGEDVVIQVEGPAGAPAAFVYSFAPISLLLPDFYGSLHVFPVGLVNLGVIPTAGALTLSVPQSLATPGDALNLFLQGVHFDAGAGSALDGVTAVTVLDPSL